MLPVTRLLNVSSPRRAPKTVWALISINVAWPKIENYWHLMYMLKLAHCLPVVLTLNLYDSSVSRLRTKLLEFTVVFTSISLLSVNVQFCVHSLSRLLTKIRLVSRKKWLLCAFGATILKRTFHGSKCTRSFPRLQSPVGIGQIAPYLPQDKRQSCWLSKRFASPISGALSFRQRSLLVQIHFCLLKRNVR